MELLSSDRWAFYSRFRFDVSRAGARRCRRTARISGSGFPAGLRTVTGSCTRQMLTGLTSSGESRQTVGMPSRSQKATTASGIYVLFTGRALALFPAKPLEHLPHAGRRRSRTTGHAVSGVRAVSRGADHLSRWAIPRILPEQRWVLALGAAPWKRPNAGSVIVEPSRIIGSSRSWVPVGEVYRRHHPKLKSDVAITTLPQQTCGRQKAHPPHS